MGDCVHKNCKYRAIGTMNNEYKYRCDYMNITGHSRTLWHRLRGLSTDPAECQCYETGKKK